MLENILCYLQEKSINERFNKGIQKFMTKDSRQQRPAKYERIDECQIDLQHAMWSNEKKRY